MVNDSNVPEAKFNWLKWLVGTAVSVITVGSSLIAILDYVDRKDAPVLATNPAAGVLAAPASLTATTVPTQTSLPTDVPTAIPVLSTETSTAIAVSPEIPTPSKPDAAAFVLAYWQNVSNHNFEAAWAQLSPEFRKTIHNDNYRDYLQGYRQMELCRIDVSGVNVLQQNDFTAIVQAHLTYYTGAQCYQSEFDFEMWLVYARSSNSWLFDRNVRR
jgi:serine/threonine-protein kinase